MKKSKLVTLGLLALVATTVACDDTNSSEEVRHCLDKDGVVVDESLCTVNQAGDAGVVRMVQRTDSNGNIIYVPDTTVVMDNSPPVVYYHWYYGGWSRPMPRGTRVIVSGPGMTGGSFHPSVGHTYSTPSTFGRGGFGGTGRSFSGGSGAGE